MPAELAERARARFAELGADGLIAIGGGSAIGLAKAIALTTHAPIVAVPTTYAGSEMTNVYGLTAEGRKRTGRDEAVRPRTVVYDPDLVRGLPPEVAGPSAMNALAHCVDALWAEGATPISTLLAEGGARALREGLDARDHERLLYGAALAGWTFGVVGGALHHRICHLLGGAFDLPHAETHSAVLSHVAALNAPAVPEASARLAAALGADDLAGGVYDLERRVGAPTGLRELGLAEERLDEVVRGGGGRRQPRAARRASGTGAAEAGLGRRAALVAGSAGVAGRESPWMSAFATLRAAAAATGALVARGQRLRLSQRHEHVGGRVGHLLVASRLFRLKMSSQPWW